VLLYRKKARTAFGVACCGLSPCARPSVGHLNLFLGNADGELLAPFAATAPEHLGDSLVTHALPELRAFGLLRAADTSSSAGITSGVSPVWAGELTFQIGAVNDWPAFWIAFSIRRSARPEGEQPS